jgi:Ca-activated chloride channel family protein
MRTVTKSKGILTAAVLFALLFFSSPAQGQILARRGQDAPQTTGGPVRIPSRGSTPLFTGKQGPQKTEIHYDPATRLVTLKLLVQDPNGYFIPNIRRENFVVYENGVRQQIASVDVDDAPVSAGLLLEFGGRYLPLNRVLAEETPRAAQQFLDAMTRNDKAAIWKYAAKVEMVSDFSQDRDQLATRILTLDNPEFSETNLYDAATAIIDQMRQIKGRKAIVLISSGLDTFSKASHDDALKAAQASDSPIYAIGLSDYLRQITEAENPGEPVAKIDWRTAKSNLSDLANASGGRAYFPKNTVDLSPMYSDLLENLKVRYIVTYRSSTEADLNLPCTVRVDLINAQSGGPLQIVDTQGKKIYAEVLLQQSYIPAQAAKGN